ncbi:general substrate transporter [Vararia minispora EC-137]|uniref:General substrate transporter n=1 Tax=Vararia minispora EC-137 TaxID=1314806 RepID=A0ACB8QJ25_9AGAM|nr:general substrate transporter [Vararia minispora EC-137]
MGFLSLVEDRPTPRAVYNARVVSCAVIASFASCMIGYDSAFIGTTIALDSFVTEFHLDALSSARRAVISANIVSIYQAGAFFGALAAFLAAHFAGRRAALQLFVTIFILGAGLSLGASGARGLGILYASRALTGLGVGGASNVTPIYIAELAPPAARGRLVGLYELGWQVGGLVGFWINYGLALHVAPSHKQWLIPFAVQLIPAGLLALGTLWIRESPRWLFQRGRRAAAVANLCWVRRLPPNDPYVVEEITQIDAAVADAGTSFLQPFRDVAQSRSIQWRLFLGGALFFWQNGSGINAINYYSPAIFRSLGLSSQTATFFTTGLFGVVKTTLTLLWLALVVDTAGRRPVLIVGALGGSAAMWAIGAYVKIVGVNTSGSGGGLSGGGVVAIFFFYLWTAFYVPSWNGTPWVLNAELFPARVRALGQASAAANNWLWNFLVSRFTPQLFLALHAHGVYFLFAALMLCSAPFVWLLVPETKGVPLEAVGRLFEVRPVRRAHAVVMTGLRAEAVGETHMVREVREVREEGSEAGTGDEEKDESVVT